MDKASREREPVIKTRFGTVSAVYGVNFDKSIKEMNTDRQWREAVRAEGQVFPAPDPWDEVPF